MGYFGFFFANVIKEANVPHERVKSPEKYMRKKRVAHANPDFLLLPKKPMFPAEPFEAAQKPVSSHQLGRFTVELQTETREI